MTATARPWLERIDPYRPGRPASTNSGALASNESPLGASPQIAEALSAMMSTIHRYPDPLADVLRTRIAEYHEVDPDQVLIGNGSDELIFLLAWAFAAHGGRVVCAEPAYRIDEISAYVAGAEVVKVPLTKRVHDLPHMAEIPADIAYVCNPHNPTGTTHPRDAIERFATTALARLLVVDEAYLDFADDIAATTAVPLASTNGAVVVLRTFSKIYGLAGLRVGYLIGDRELVDTLRKIRAPFSVNAAAQHAAVAALGDRAHWTAVREHVIDYRSRLTRLLESHGRVVVPSQANFVLVEAPDEDEFVSLFASHGIAVRGGRDLDLPGTVRISVPSAHGYDLLAAALREQSLPPITNRPPSVHDACPHR